MILNKFLRKSLIGFIFTITCLLGQSQIRPEVTVGLKYNSDNLFLTTHDNHPLAIEIGGGLNFNERWYTGIKADYFNTKSSYSDTKYYLIELELRRSFNIKSIPRFGLNLSFRPGYMLIDSYSYRMSTQMDLHKTLAISFSTGITYNITNHFKFTIWPGITWLPQESFGYDNNQRIGAHCGAGVSYNF